MANFKRLAIEAKLMETNPPEFIRAKPSEKDLLRFHYVLQGPPDTPYAGGYYHGVLIFPHQYPMKPPEIRMLTPSGRFEVNKPLCLSMSSFHPETWNPVWSVSTVLLGLLSFMTAKDRTAGSIETSDTEKRVLAARSLEYNVKNDRDFCALFPSLVEELQRRQEAAASAAASGGGGAGVATVDLETEIAARAAEDAKKNPGVNILSLLGAAVFIVLAIMFAVWQRQQGGTPVSGRYR